MNINALRKGMAVKITHRQTKGHKTRWTPAIVMEILSNGKVLAKPSGHKGCITVEASEIDFWKSANT